MWRIGAYGFVTRQSELFCRHGVGCRSPLKIDSAFARLQPRSNTCADVAVVWDHVTFRVIFGFQLQNGQSMATSIYLIRFSISYQWTRWALVASVNWLVSATMCRLTATIYNYKRISGILQQLLWFSFLGVVWWTVQKFLRDLEQSC